MNKIIRKEANSILKSMLEKCTEQQIHIFKRMYSPKDLELNINEVVENMPDDKIDWAMTQVQNTIEKNNFEMLKSSIESSKSSNIEIVNRETKGLT